MALDTGDWVKIIAALIGLSYPLLEKLLKGAKDADDGEILPPPRPAPEPRAAEAKPPPATPPPSPAPSPFPSRAAPPAIAPRREPSPAQRQLADALAAVARDAAALAESIRQEPANHRFIDVLHDWLPQRCRALEQRVLDGGALLARADVTEAQSLILVFQEVQELVRQRRDPQLLPLLGDADRLAEQCYAPVVAFAQAEGLPLTSARPVAQLTEFDLGIWTGFAPTALAPIFLPPTFFDNIWHWPAIAHEIGHDFLVSIEGLRDRIGDELGLPSEAQGTLPLRFYGNELPASELWRIHGAWLEELFADVFGTLMCGPAYAATMVELFSYKENQAEVIFVPIDRQTGRYGIHPPHHVRIHASCAVLERAGFAREAEAILQRWYERNQLDREKGVPLLVWAHNQFVYLPFSAFEPLTRDVVMRLYEGPLECLSGFGLQDISGLDYGPHAHAEAERARTALLSGRVPKVRDARAVISGAVMATLEQRDQHAKILSLARQAISAVGTHEQAPDAYRPAVDAPAPRVFGGLDLSDRALAEAVLLREVLARPKPGPGVRRRMRRSA